jgi:hypothetical protein
VGAAVAALLPILVVVRTHRSPSVVHVTQTPSTLAPAPTRPTGRFVPTYLPHGLRLVTEAESASPPFGGGPPGRSRTYDNAAGGNGDVITTSLATDAAALDVRSEVAHYPGARSVEIQGHDALFLPPVAARSGWVVAWAPAPGQLAQVLVNAAARPDAGAPTGLGDQDVLALADALRIPELDDTPLPAGFAPRRGGSSDSHAMPPPVPRNWTATYSDVDPAPGDATGIAPNAANRHSVSITTSWRSELSPGAPAGRIRGHDALAPSAPEGYRSLEWEERAGLQVVVTGERVDDAQLRRVAEGLREQSEEEVLGATTASAVSVGRADVAGRTYELVSSHRPSGVCVELRTEGGGPGGIACGFDPSTPVLTIGITTQGSPRILFGAARRQAAHVRVEVADGLTVDATTVAGPDGTYWLAALPEGEAVAAVVATDSAGRVVERRDLLPVPPSAPPPPWVGPRVPLADVPPELQQAWSADTARDGCAALMLTDQGDGAGATPRIASFGAAAWAVAFDKPGLPGTDADGRPSPDSGRSAFGVAGTAIDVGVQRIDGWPEHRVWQDGSRADYGPEGGTGPTWLAQLYVRGQRCGYNVWSALGKEHLERLLDGIRFVAGMP